MVFGEDFWIISFGKVARCGGWLGYWFRVVLLGKDNQITSKSRVLV